MQRKTRARIFAGLVLAMFLGFLIYFQSDHSWGLSLVMTSSILLVVFAMFPESYETKRKPPKDRHHDQRW
jgi:high-affinity Fe2+/Pb2+ permease